MAQKLVVSDEWLVVREKAAVPLPLISHHPLATNH